MKKILISIILCGCKTAVSREIKTEITDIIKLKSMQLWMKLKWNLQIAPYWNYLLMKQMSKIKILMVGKLLFMVKSRLTRQLVSKI